ncbi:AAA family ATPase [bacterium]|nr:AAA family ATPase [bacterium]
MTTRIKNSGDALSQERWMSSEEYVALRSINGLATTAKAGLLTGSELKRLLFWIQGRSQMPGGLLAIARDLVEMFPENLPTPTARKTGSNRGARASGESAMATGTDYQKVALEKLPRHLIQICVNPYIELDSDADNLSAGYQRNVMEQVLPDVSRLTGEHVREGFRTAAVPYFRDLLGSLLELMHRDCKRAADAHALTSVGQTIWKQLDFCRRTHQMIVIEGREGIGKTEAVNAWCAAHEGEVRRVSLTSTTNQTEFFRELAAAVGVACSYMRKVNEMKPRATDVLRRSGLMLVIDEGHYLLPQTKRVVARPVLLDWLYSGLNNFGVPVALIATPQFSQLAANVEKCTGWNSGQFLRRSKRFVELPPRLGDSDLRIVARALLPGASETLVGVVAAYASLKEHQLDAIKDIVTEAQALAEESGRDTIKSTDLERAMKEVIEPTLLAKTKALGRQNATARPARGPSAAASRQLPGNVMKLTTKRRGTVPVTEAHEHRFPEASALAG